jgi:hypothetical protein
MKKVEKRQKQPKAMCEEVIRDKYAGMNFTNFTKALEYDAGKSTAAGNADSAAAALALVNATNVEKAMAIAQNVTDTCKAYCVELEDWRASSAAAVTGMEGFNSTAYEAGAGSMSDLMPPVNPDPMTCDEALTCTVVGDFTPMEQLHDMSMAIMSRRVRRQRRARRMLIEKRRRLSLEADGEAAAKENEMNCVTLNGDKYCKEGASSASNGRRLMERRLQQEQELMEERGIDSVLPAVSSAIATKPQQISSRHFRMRKGHARSLRMLAKKNKRKMLARR